MLLLYHISIKMLSWSLISFSFIESLSKALFISCILVLLGMIPLFQSTCVLRLNLVMERLHWIWRKAILLLRRKDVFHQLSKKTLVILPWLRCLPCCAHTTIVYCGWKDVQQTCMVWKIILPIGHKNLKFSKWSLNWEGSYIIVKILRIYFLLINGR